MVFPDILTVEVIERGTTSPVADIALVLVLKASQKNDYYVGPIITNRDGRAEFTRTVCEQAIARAQEMFIMDYTGDLSSCKPTADLRTHRPEQIARMIQQYEASPQFWGRAFDNAPALFRRLKSVKNADFESTQLTLKDVDIVARPEISIAVQKITLIP